MVREYLKSVLHEIEEQRKANTAEIEEQRLEKETIDKKIARIQSKKEFDMEYFSPRRSEGSLREQLADLQKNNMILKEELRKLEEAAAGKKTGKFPENAGRSGRAGEKGKKVKCFT